MAKSKRTQVDTENLELEEALEAEGLEAADEELDEPEAIEASDEDDEEEAEVEEKKKPARKPRARKPRAKKAEPSLLGAMSEPIEEKTEEKAEAETPALEVAAVAEEEAPAPKPRAKRVTKAEQEEADAIGKPWVAVKEISGSISSNLERVNQMLREIPQQELFRPPVAKPAAITKVAVGMSFFAIVLSLVSLLLSQSARQVALERFAAPTSAIAQVAPTTEPKQLAFEASMPKRKPQRSTRKATH